MPVSNRPSSPPGHVLLLGGAKSGKSALAERLALDWSRDKRAPAYIATGRALDGEMEMRIQRHRRQRNRRFTTLEEPVELGAAIVEAARNHDVILVDCLTVWLSTIRFSADNPSAAALPPLFDDPRIVSLQDALKRETGSRIILVSNEVGMGIVPDNRLARRFRDEAGELHQALGELCDSVNLVVAGLGLPLKGPCLT